MLASSPISLKNHFFYFSLSFKHDADRNSAHVSATPENCPPLNAHEYCSLLRPDVGERRRLIVPHEEASVRHEGTASMMLMWAVGVCGSCVAAAECCPACDVSMMSLLCAGFDWLYQHASVSCVLCFNRVFHLRRKRTQLRKTLLF